MTVEEFREKYGSLERRSHVDEAIEIVMIRYHLSIRKTLQIAFEEEPTNENWLVLHSVIAETERIERQALRV